MRVILIAAAVLFFGTGQARSQKPPSVNDMRSAASKADWNSVISLGKQLEKKNGLDTTATLLLTYAHLQKSDLAQANLYALRGVKLYPLQIQFYVLASETLVRTNQLDSAAEILNAASRVFPDSSRVLASLGMLYVRMEKCELAITPLEEAMFRRPNELFIAEQLAHCYLRTNRYAEASELYGRIFELAPNSLPVLQGLAESMFITKKFDSAAVLYEMLYLRSPKTKELYSPFAKSLLSIHKVDSALAVLKKYTELAPSDAEAWYNLGIAQNGTLNHTEAIRSFKKAVAIKSNFGEAYFNLALAYQGDGFIDEAIHSFKRASVIIPTLAPDAYNSIAIMFRQQSKFQQAYEYHHRAISLNDTAVVYRTALANSYFVAEKFQDGLNELEKVFDRFSYSADFLHAMGRIYVRVGNREKVDGIVEKLETLDKTLANDLRNMLKI